MSYADYDSYADDHGEKILAQIEMECSLENMANRVKMTPAHIFIIGLLATLLAEIYKLAIDNIQ